VWRVGSGLIFERTAAQDIRVSCGLRSRMAESRYARQGVEDFFRLSFESWHWFDRRDHRADRRGPWGDPADVQCEALPMHSRYTDGTAVSEGIAKRIYEPVPCRTMRCVIEMSDDDIGDDIGRRCAEKILSWLFPCSGEAEIRV